MWAYLLLNVVKQYTHLESNSIYRVLCNYICSPSQKSKVVQRLIIAIFILSSTIVIIGCDTSSDSVELTHNEKVTELAQRETGGIPVEVLFKNPNKSSYRISPDGKFLSFLSPFESRQNIHIQALGTNDTLRLTSNIDRDIDYYFWKSNNTLIYLKDSDGDENYRIFAIDIDGNERELASFSNVRVNVIDELHNDENAIIISMNKNNPALFEPYRLNIRNGNLKQLATNTDIKNPITNWVVDNGGKLRVAVSVEKGTETHLLYRNTEADEFQTILTSNWKDMVAPLFFDKDDKHIIAISNHNRDKSALVRLDPANPENLEVIFEHPEVDVWWADRSVKTGNLGSVYYITDRKHTFYMDTVWEKVAKKVEESLPSKEIYFNAMDNNDSIFIIRSYSDKSPGDFYIYSRATERLNHLINVNPELESYSLSSMKPIDFEARDGSLIHGYLSLPPDQTSKDLPIVVMIHGGPLSRDLWGFKPDVQMLTSRGYGVLQINYRGSWGYGKKFAQSGFKQWGQLMQDDITDGVNWLIDNKVADPKRVAIYGASYGGYAALAGMTFTEDLYACGVSYVGPSNLFTLLENLPAYWEPEKEMMYEMIGHPVADSALLYDISPAFHADRIKSPLFIAQGANDVRVTTIEAEQMVSALEKNKVEVVYMLKENEGHGFRLEENKLEFYKALCGFLDEHIPSDGKRHKP